MTPNIDFEKIVKYLEDLGSKHVDINKTVRWNRAELQGQMRTENLESIMLIDAPEFQSEGSQNNIHSILCAFTILGKKNVATPKIDDYDKQNEIIDHCLNICFEVAARIQRDAYESSNEKLKWLYAALQKASYQYIKVGPIFTNHLYGYRCQFEIRSPEVYKLDPAKWTDK